MFNIKSSNNVRWGSWGPSEISWKTTVFQSHQPSQSKRAAQNCGIRDGETATLMRLGLQHLLKCSLKHGFCSGLKIGYKVGLSKLLVQWMGVLLFTNEHVSFQLFLIYPRKIVLFQKIVI